MTSTPLPSDLTGPEEPRLRGITPEEIFGGLLLVAATLLGTMQVTFRSLGAETFIWAEEAVVVMIVWSVFFGAAGVTYRRLHIRVEIVALAFGPVPRLAIELAASLVFLTYNAVALYLAWQFLFFLRMTGETNPSMLIPQWILIVGFPIGMACVLIRSAQDTWRYAREFMRRLRDAST
jgi:TRAP-type C4-dicarboxylate transport system permease small subunit